MRQRAAVLRAPQAAEVQWAALPALGPKQVRVRLQGCGICASNLPVWEGRDWFQYPLAGGAPGHEGWGIVEQVGPGVQAVQEGERVAMLSGNAFAQFDTADQRHVVRIPESFSGRPFPAEPLGCAMNIFERSEVRAGQRVAIVGAGFLGLLLVQLVKSAGASAVVLSRRPYALHLAQSAGAVAVIDMSHEPERRALEISGGRGFERVIEIAGLQATLDVASALTAEYGRLIIAGYHQDGLRSVNMQQWNWRAMEVINAHERDPDRYVHGMAAAINAMSAGLLDPYPFITHQLELAELNSGFQMMSERPDGFIKAVVRMSGRE